MTRKPNHRPGFTLTEVALSLAILVIVWVATIEVIFLSKMSGSQAKHKAQAVLVMQRAMEDLRKKPFTDIASSASTVSIDTRGTPDAYSDDLTGTQTITVTAPDPFYKKIIVAFSWNEPFLGKNKPVTDYLGTYIANDPQAN